MFDLVVGFFHFVVENSFLICVACGIIYYIITRKQCNTITERSKLNKTSCGNEACVRCQMYTSVIHEASLRLKGFSESEDVEITKTISNALEQTKVLNSLAPTDLKTQYPNILLYGCLEAKPFWRREIFIDVTLLEESFQTISLEYQKLRRQSAIGFWKRNTTPMGSWDVFPLINQGCWIEENVEICPETSKILSQMQDMMSENVFGNAMFSVLKPGTVISEHYGPTNLRLRCHLGLVTTPESELTVAGITRTWETGECLVFDDSFLHSVQHSGQDCVESRVVFIVDLWHPSVKQRDREIINHAFSAR